MTDYNIRFDTRDFDCGALQGLSVAYAGQRLAIRINKHDDPETIAERLRALATWLEARYAENTLT